MGIIRIECKWDKVHRKERFGSNLPDFLWMAVSQAFLTIGKGRIM